MESKSLKCHEQKSPRAPLQIFVFHLFPFPLRILVLDVCLDLLCVFTLAKIIPFAEYLAQIVAGPVAGKDGWASRRAARWAGGEVVCQMPSRKTCGISPPNCRSEVPICLADFFCGMSFRMSCGIPVAISWRFKIQQVSTAQKLAFVFAFR